MLPQHFGGAYTIQTTRCEPRRNLASTTQRWIPASVQAGQLNILVIIPYFKTAGGPNNDAEWSSMLSDIALYTAKTVHQQCLDDWIWIGDFNYQPSHITGKRDPSKARAEAWSSTLKRMQDRDGKPKVMNPQQLIKELPQGNR